MNPSVITILVLGIVSILVVGLMVFAYYQIIKSTKKLTTSGLLDEEYLLESKHKEKKASTILINIFSISVTCVLVTICGIGLTYRINGEQFTINKQTAFVIASNSMEDYVSQEYKNILVDEIATTRDISTKEAETYISRSQFHVGDMLTFTSISESDDLSLYSVYAYKNSKGQIIVHRLVGIKDNYYIFRGDNTPGNDTYVTRNQILYQYNNTKVDNIGNFVLFSSSSFGLYSLFIVILIFIMSDIAKHQTETIKKNRLLELQGEKKNETK